MITITKKHLKPGTEFISKTDYGDGLRKSWIAAVDKENYYIHSDNSKALWSVKDTEGFLKFLNSTHNLAI